MLAAMMMMNTTTAVMMMMIRTMVRAVPITAPPLMVIKGGANLQYTIHNIQYAMTIYVSQHTIYNIHYSNTFHCECLLLFSFLESYNQHIPKLNLTAIKQLGETAAAVPQISKIQFL